MKALIEKFRDAKIGVIGDLVADIYIYGTPTRVSREAPVLIIRHEEEHLVPGSAANAAANLIGLGATVRPIGIVGDDAPGGALKSYFAENGMDTGALISIPGRGTTTKTRILAGDVHTSKQQVVRVDREYATLPRDAKEKILSAIDEINPSVDAWLVSDYGYGTADLEVIQKLTVIAESGKFVLGDSRYRLGNFYSFSMVVPNEQEAGALAGRDFESTEALMKLGDALRTRHRWQALLVTLGNRGMMLFEEGREPELIPIAGSSDIVDVSGAGDTVAATALLAIVSGGTFGEAAHLANHAAGVVVMKRGTATLSAAELAEAVEEAGHA